MQVTELHRAVPALLAELSRQNIPLTELSAPIPQLSRMYSSRFDGTALTAMSETTTIPDAGARAYRSEKLPAARLSPITRSCN